MRFVDLIEKKKQGHHLSKEEIDYWIDGFVKGDIPDYQVSALCMAICFQGMSDEEQFCLTEAMLHSGKIIDLSPIHTPICDKHSTGGVGDKTSLALAPMVAACGLCVAKMSGRGLGHTGGTLDKLESIHGFQINKSEDDFMRQVQDIGLAIVSQSDTLVPADRLLYALRDVSATVDSIPLIASSIMSKKLAMGADTILLDVKYGNGAFMNTSEKARKLAQAMLDIAKRFHKKACAMITNMNQPLGNAVGNALEVKEAIETLQGKGSKDFTQLCLEAGSLLLTKTHLSQDREDGIHKLKQVIENGKALEKFLAMVAYQGGDVLQITDPNRLPKANMQIELLSTKNGFVQDVCAHTIGVSAMKLGAGRSQKHDHIQHETGIILKKKQGDFVQKGEALAVIHTNQALEEQIRNELFNAFTIGDAIPQIQPLIEEVML